MQSNFHGKTVLVTGHTGFKGSWLSIWLQELGAKVVGYALPPPTEPNLFTLAGLTQSVVHVVGDVRDFAKLDSILQEHQPDVIFHLAAQPIVLHSYERPKETFDVNAGGTVNLLEAARRCPSVKAIVVVTTDKCYENQHWTWGYREIDRLGGHDPYSASKSMAELAAASYRSSFFQDSIALATARAGNVIGGGDFSDCRIVPDCMRALMSGKPVEVRNPLSVRPWLYVLDALSGYLWLAAKLMQDGQSYAEAWNFGPRERTGVTVQEVVKKSLELWGRGQWVNATQPNAKPEMGLLLLDWDKAGQRLEWSPAYDLHQALHDTVDWFRSYSKQKEDIRNLCIRQIQDYACHAQKQHLPWTAQSSLQTAKTAKGGSL